ncbi:GNAT family protein [Pontibacter rugosus]
MKTHPFTLQWQVTPAIHVREASPADAPALYHLINRDRAYLREWLPFVDMSQSAADTEAYLRYVSADGNTSDLVFVILYKEELAGLIGYKGIDRLNKKLEIGYWLAEPQQGKGIMRRSCQTLLRHAFDTLNMNRIELRVGVGNTRSSNIPQKLGFTLEGIQRQGSF